MCKHYISNIVDSPYKKETETWPEVKEIRNQTLLGIFRGNLLLEHPKRKRMTTWRSRNAIIDFVDSGIMNQTCHWLLLHVNMVILKYYLLYKMIQVFAPLFKILTSNFYSHQIILMIIGKVKWLKKIHLKHQKWIILINICIKLFETLSWAEPPLYLTHAICGLPNLDIHFLHLMSLFSL